MLRILQFVSGVLIFTNNSLAQVVAGSAYLQGQFVEVVLSECGNHIVSDSLPEGPKGPYHFETERQGAICDVEKNGWLDFCGDYFSLGAAVEGWGIQIGSNMYLNQQEDCSGYGGTSGDITGNIVAYGLSSEGQYATWEGELLISDEQQLTVRKTIELFDSARYFTTTFMLTNSGMVDLNGFYLAQNVDPDNGSICAEYYETYNQIVLNTPASDTSWVSASGLECECYMAYASADARSRAAYGNFFIEPSTIAQMYAGTGGYEIAGGIECDCSIQMVYLLDLAVGETTFLRYSTLFAAEEFSSAISNQSAVLMANGAPVWTGQEINLCEGNNVELYIDGPEGFEWSWEPSLYLSTTTGTTTICAAAESIHYVLTGTNGENTIVKEFDISVSPTIIPIIETTPINGTFSPGVASVTSISGGTPPYFYNWFNGATDSTTIILAPGFYELTITDAVGCSQPVSFYVDIINGLSDDAAGNISAYPNPAKNSFFLAGLPSTSAHIEVLDIMGKHVATITSSTKDIIEINTVTWPSGLYFIKIITNNAHALLSLQIVSN